MATDLGATTESAADRPRTRGWQMIALTTVSVVLALAAAYVHWTLGGILFTLNAIGYATLAVALIVPIGLVDRFRWLVRLGLLGFTLATIAGWIVFGARIPLGYFTAAMEIVLVAFLVVSIYRADGGPLGVLARVRALPAELIELVRAVR